MRTGFDRNPDRKTTVQICPKRPRVFGHLIEVFTAAGGYELQTHAIHSHLDLVWILHAPHQFERVPPQSDFDGVLAIHGKCVPDEKATASARRESIEMLILRKVRPNAISGGAGCDFDIPQRGPADIPGGRQIALHQRWWNLEDVRDVVESAALVVWRQ